MYSMSSLQDTIRHGHGPGTLHELSNWTQVPSLHELVDLLETPQGPKTVPLVSQDPAGTGPARGNSQIWGRRHKVFCFMPAITAKHGLCSLSRPSRDIAGRRLVIHMCNAMPSSALPRRGPCVDELSKAAPCPSGISVLLFAPVPHTAADHQCVSKAEPLVCRKMQNKIPILKDGTHPLPSM